MAISIVNNVWAVDESITSSTGVEKMLATAGTFLDRNIKISIVPQPGKITLTDDSDTQQVLTLSSDTDKYEVKATSTITVTPNISEGWVDSVETKIIKSENTLYLDKTVLNAGLTSDNLFYRISASKGYNEEELSKNINVFQGEVTI